MKRSRYVPIALTFALILPMAGLIATAQQPVADVPEKVVTEAHNGYAVTLNEGEVLVVQLKGNPSTGYSRALVSFPDMPVRLVSYRLLPKAPEEGETPRIGAPRVYEWRFEVTGEAAFGRTVWLKLPLLRPFAKGVSDAGLWEIKVNVPKSPAE